MFGFLRKKISAFSKSLEPKIRLRTKIKKTVIGKAALSDEELNTFLSKFELSLMEADVALEVAEKICSGLRERLRETSFSRGEDIAKKLNLIFRETLAGMLDENKSFDLLSRIKQKPAKVLFLGPNGAGKTTAIAKICFLLQQNGLTSIFAASDTFRAASIEQLEEHGRRLSVKVIKHDYGADPTAVAYDAVAYAKAHAIDAVLIDTAGRQETNINLVEQLKKINRVIQPDLKIFVGEAVVGNVILEQIKPYREIGLDGVILTKLDLDVKGGAMLSLISTGVPVLYFGTGQNYSDLIRFEKNYLLEKLFE